RSLKSTAVLAVGQNDLYPAVAVDIARRQRIRVCRLQVCGDEGRDIPILAAAQIERDTNLRTSRTRIATIRTRVREENVLKPIVVDVSEQRHWRVFDGWNSSRKEI